MKSIMEEASSIFKAIEKGWTRAGKPSEFTIKVYEEPQHNFLGMTIKSAKIGIFFSDSTVQHKPADKQVSPVAHRPGAKAKPPKRKIKAEAINAASHPVDKERKIDSDKDTKTFTETPKISTPLSTIKAPQDIKSRVSTPASEKSDLQISQKPAPKSDQPWTKEMISSACGFLDDTFKMLNLQNTYTTETSHLYLKFIFNTEIFEDQNRQKQFFASLATLIIQMLKKRFKRPLKGYKIILQTIK